MCGQPLTGLYPEPHTLAPMARSDIDSRANFGSELTVTQTRTWESAERSTRPKGSLVDGVGIVAILEKSTGPELLLQKQYRAPIDKICIEVKAHCLLCHARLLNCFFRYLLA